LQGGGPVVPQPPVHRQPVVDHVAAAPFLPSAQEQIATFFATDGAEIIHPEPARFFEVPIQEPLPEDLSYIVPPAAPRGAVAPMLAAAGTPAAASRSMVTSLTVPFSTVVTLDRGALETVRQEGRVIQITGAQEVLDGHSVDTVTFSGAGIIGGSLADGYYVLTIRRGLVHDGCGNALDGAGTGVAGSDRVDTFFRLFGDANGDGVVDEQDRAQFRAAFKTKAGEAGSLSYFDFDRDGAIDGLDNGEFNRGFGLH
jgi:hypothetical protein